MNPYAHLFNRYVHNSIRAVHTNLLALDEHLPSEDDLSLALHSLGFSLPVDDAWAASREVLVLLAPKMEQAGFRDGWLPFLERGIERSRANGDRGAEGEFHYQLGLLHELRARFADAQTCYQTSAALFAGLGERGKEARSINRQAYTARLQQRLPAAIELVNRALSLLPEEATERAGCYFTWGTIAFDQRQWAESIGWFTRSLAEWERQENPRMVAWSLRNLGPALHRAGRYDEAIACYERALGIFDEVPDVVHQALTRMNLGIVYSLTGSSERALALYAQAEPVFRAAQDDMRLALLSGNRGYAHRQLSQWQAAEDAYRQSIELWKQIGVKASVVNGMDGLGLVQLGKGDRQAASAIFNTALACLEEMPDDPRHDYLHQMVCGHLRQAEGGESMPMEKGLKEKGASD
jgi:tetratricopeptide (TPR) repeat protein